MNIGLLQCGRLYGEIAARHGQYPGIFARLFEGRGLRLHTFDVEALKFPESVHVMDGWLISGSRHGAYEDHAFIPPLEDFIRAVHTARRPTVGICFGHQIIAQALGGRVVKFDGGWGLGRQDYDFDGLGPLALNAWHQDQVVRLPDDARRVATNDFCQNAALVYGDHILTVQPHPEFGADVMTDFTTYKRDEPTYPKNRMDHAAREAAQGLPLDQATMAAHLAGFLKASHAARAGAHV